MSEKYISMSRRVTGFSFANLGAFYGLADGIISAVLSLILMQIFNNASAIGVYSALYYAFYMFVGLFIAEFIKIAPKAKLFYWSIIAVAVMYFGMSFSIKPFTFVALDFASAIPLMLVSSLISLFLTDFKGDADLSRLNGRNVFWSNMGYLVAPFLALSVAEKFGMRSPFFLVALIYLGLTIYFASFKLRPVHEIPKSISLKRSIRNVMRSARAYFKRGDLIRAYVVNFSSYSLIALRSIYVPVMVVAAGFSTGTLAWVLAAGIVPYVILAEPMSWFAKHVGTRRVLITAFILFAICAAATFVLDGWALLAIFVLWQIPGAMIEPLRDMLFFDSASKSDVSRLFGIFKTSSRLPRFIIPLVAAGAIAVTGVTGAVWLVAIVVCACAAGVLSLAKKS
ncbi:MAG: MFS transporter [Rickettsiales bacterium]|jgi:MFS family permease|nr:MFS transporter [Rickettsiales bacterium]